MYLDHLLFSNPFFSLAEELVYPSENGTIRFKVPGYNVKTLTVEVDGKYLRIKGNNGTHKLDTTYRVPRNVCLNNATASVVDGILTIKTEIYKESEKRTLQITEGNDDNI